MDEIDQILVTTAPLPNSSRYAVEVQIGEDIAVHLPQGKVQDYARRAIQVAAWADYDAAVVKQMRDIAIADHTQQEVTEIVSAAVVYLRKQRANSGTVRLLANPRFALTPGVSAFTGKGFITLYLDGQTIGQWDPDDVRSHAMGVLDAGLVADLDGTYKAWLLKEIKLDEATAGRVVGTLKEFRV